ncbi:uncharacterized protein LOC116294279 isoform X7 [Actinia tenebrosa]|uniref:Uncharacterized protein LOC116294279 isoform X7 n=1 Tax=Actinia tenebrosa TaxID=6105 RepID=A0A6P8HYL0_ACTTE|nr:uncharacterized protein LOC116294279 isoform X7 [Actinia tenebrosa]
MKPINMSLLQGQMAKKGLDWKGQIQYLDWDDDNIRLSQCKLRDREWQPKLKHQYIVLETKNWSIYLYFKEEKDWKTIKGIYIMVYPYPITQPREVHPGQRTGGGRSKKTERESYFKEVKD